MTLQLTSNTLQHGNKLLLPPVRYPDRKAENQPARLQQAGSVGPFFPSRYRQPTGFIKCARRECVCEVKPINVRQQVPATAHGITHSVTHTDEHRTRHTHAWLSRGLQTSDSSTRILSADLSLKSPPRWNNSESLVAPLRTD